MVEKDEVYEDVYKAEDIEAPEDREMTTLNEEERQERAKKIIEKALKFTTSDKTDDVRAEHASDNGGFQLYDEDALATIRSAASIILDVRLFSAI